MPNRKQNNAFLAASSPDYVASRRSALQRLGLGIMLPALFLSAGAVFADFDNTAFAAGNWDKKVEGYLYTSLNGEGVNTVVSFERLEDGSLGAQKSYSTKSAGGANVKAGGDAAGDFDAQGAMRIIGNHMLVVNAGGNTISVFTVDRKTGGLTHSKNVASGGARPVSAANSLATLASEGDGTA